MDQEDRCQPAILLVDDDPIQLRVLRAALAHTAEVRVASSGPEALRLLAAQPADILVTDLLMDGMSGLELLAAVQELGLDLGCIMLTGCASKDAAVGALKQGADDFLEKPVNLEMLKKSVSRIWSAIHAGRENARLLRKLDLNNRELTRQKEWIAAIVEEASEAILTFRLDGAVVCVNRAAQALFQREHDDLLARRITDLLCEPPLATILEKAERCGTLPDAGHCLEGRGRLPDGTTVLLEFSVRRTRGEGGGLVVGILRDIGERRRRETENRLLSMAVEQAGDAIVVTDPGGRIEYANRAFERLTGRTRTEALGSRPAILELIQSGAGEWQEAARDVAAGKSYSGQFLNKRKDGAPFHEDATISPITDEQGKVTHLVCVGRDVSRQRALETQLSQAQKLESIGQLAAGIAHEINTPTQYVGDNTRFFQESVESLFLVVDRALELLAAAAAGPVPPALLEKTREAVAQADIEYLREEVPNAIRQSLDGVQRVSEIVRGMKEFSHPDAGERTAVDLNRAIRSTATVARNEWKYHAELELDLDPELPPVPCFAGELNQVVLNMIVNAAHAIAERHGTGQKGTIAIATRRQGESVVITIQDDGAGIPDHIQDRVFDPFFTTKEVGKGTGQGLAIARNVIVKKHRGTIDLASRPGAGTTFTIRLPLAQEAAAAAETLAGARAG